MGVPYFKVRWDTRPRALGLWNEARERIQENGISLTLVTNGWNVGRCVDVSPARQVESPVPGLVSVSRRGPRRGPPEVGSGEEPTRLWWLFPPGFQHQNVRLVQKRENKPGSQARKGKFIRGNRKGDWLLRRTSILPFWWSPSYTPPVKNSLKGWSRSQRSGIWWSCGFEKIDTSKITGCNLGNFIVSQITVILFFVFEVHIMSHHINETPCGPYQIPETRPGSCWIW